MSKVKQRVSTGVEDGASGDLVGIRDNSSWRTTEIAGLFAGPNAICITLLILSLNWNCCFSVLFPHNSVDVRKFLDSLQFFTPPHSNFSYQSFPWLTTYLAKILATLCFLQTDFFLLRKSCISLSILNTNIKHFKITSVNSFLAYKGIKNSRLFFPPVMF